MYKYANREQIEWTNLYWDNANKGDLPRILLIGDSISVGYRPFVERALQGKYYVDLFATSKSVADESYFKELKYVLSEYDYKVIHFNNGLHGGHLTDEEYKTGMIKLVKILKSHPSKLVWTSSTPISAPNDTYKLDTKNDQVISRNAVAKEIAIKNNIEIDDLYSLVLGKGDIRLPDQYHYNEKGQQLEAESVVKSILNVSK